MSVPVAGPNYTAIICQLLQLNSIFIHIFQDKVVTEAEWMKIL